MRAERGGDSACRITNASGLASTPYVDARTKSGDPPLSVALAYGRGKTAVSPLIAAGADVNAEDRDGTTPLFRAAVSADPGTVTYLLDHGARGSARAESPLRLAQRLGRPAVSRVLRQRGIE